MHSNGIASRSLNVYRFPAGDLRQKQGFAAVLIISDQIGNRIFQIILRFFQFESIPFGNEKAAEKHVGRSNRGENLRFFLRFS